MCWDVGAFRSEGEDADKNVLSTPSVYTHISRPCHSPQTTSSPSSSRATKASDSVRHSISSTAMGMGTSVRMSSSGSSWCVGPSSPLGGPLPASRRPLISAL